MYKIKRFLNKLFTPLTIMLIPHDSKRTINIKFPSIGVVISGVLWVVGTTYVISIAVNSIEYHNMKDKVNFYTNQFIELNATISALKKAEVEFKRLLSFGSKDKILENVDAKTVTYDAGSLDMDILREHIKETVEKVSAIQDFLKSQRNIYMATPKGWPVSGRVTSDFGNRENPLHGSHEFHSGLDIAAAKGTPVKATADGVVSYSGWVGGNGNLVAIEHGFGYSSLYAHNSSNNVKVGQRVKRGDVIAYVGSTGNATGPHLHYEVWHNGRPVNPKAFVVKEARNVYKEFKER